MTEHFAGDPVSLHMQTESSSMQHTYVIGADIGGTNLRLALADNKGKIITRWSTSTSGIQNPKTVVDLICDGVDLMLQQTSIPHDTLAAIGAGAPGITNTTEGIVIATSYLMGWRDLPLRTMLETALGIPAAVDNDVNLAALGEHRFGAAHGIHDFVFIAIGTGVGAGIILNDQLFHGSGWTAGEIGYMLVPGISAAPIERGQPGALESIVGGEGIQAQWRSRWSNHTTALAKDASATEIFDEAINKGLLASEILQLTARTLAYAIYNTSLLLNCPLFVLGGGIGLHPAIEQATQSLLNERGTRVHPRILRSALGAEAQLIGAICLAQETAKVRNAPTVR